jgi:SAM-dependent methyltransferase
MPGAAIDRYCGEAGRRYHETKRAIPEPAIPWVARLRARKIAPHVNSADVVVEYGVGYGWNLAALTCRRRVGIDVAEFLEPWVRRCGIEFASDPAALPEGLADVLLCHHTLEHVLHPPDALGESHRLLRPGGKLLLFVPFERERRYRRFEPAEPNHHLYSWNAQTLANLISDCGFQVVEAGVRRFGYDRFAAVWAWRLRAGERGFRWLRAACHAVRPLREVSVAARRP